MKRAEAERRIAELVDELRRHDELYYVRDAPQVSDAAYDELFQELRQLEEEHLELRRADSPTQRVGGRPLDSLPTIEHLAPMLSLDSSQEEESLRRFDERLRKALGDEVAYFVEPKFDGASVELVYEEAVLVRATTRGDGAVGEGVTENARTIRSLPLRLNEDERPVPGLVALRGEVMLYVEDFEQLNERLIADGVEPFANPRNAAAGALRQLDPRLTARRPLRVVVYDLLAVEGAEFGTQSELVEALRDWGLPVPDRRCLASSVEEVVAFHRELEAERDRLPYEADGIVVKLEDLAARQELGSTSHHPRWAFAYKFPARKEVTMLDKILWSVGRTGVVTPVALLRPVDLGGVTVSRATLHNLDELKRKGVREGDRVRIQRAGDVIPQVVEVVSSGSRRGRAPRPPAKCPSCGTALERRGPFLACPNALGCTAQLVGRLVHFGSRHALDIEGLGEETAKLLVAEGLVETLPDLFGLEAERLAELPGFAEKSSGALVEAIRRSVDGAALARFLYALGIPEVGRTVAAALAEQFGSIDRLRRATVEELQETPGIGPKMAELIHGFFAEPQNAAVLDRLLAGPVRLERATSHAADDSLAGLSFVFTGALESMSRPEAQRRVEELGGRVVSSVSKKTSYVVVGSEPGSKAERARELGVEVLGEEEFVKLLEESRPEQD